MDPHWHKANSVPQRNLDIYPDYGSNAVPVGQFDQWIKLINGSIVFVFPVDPGEDPGDFLVLQRHQELLGERARDCGVSMTIEKTGMEDTGQYTQIGRASCRERV